MMMIMIQLTMMTTTVSSLTLQPLSTFTTALFCHRGTINNNNARDGLFSMRRVASMSSLPLPLSSYLSESRLFASSSSFNSKSERVLSSAFSPFRRVSKKYLTVMMMTTKDVSKNDTNRGFDNQFGGGSYGRGTPICPPTNMDVTFRLEDSFPGGKLPPSLSEALEAVPTMTTTPKNDTNIAVTTTASTSTSTSTSTPTSTSASSSTIDRFLAPTLVLMLPLLGLTQTSDVIFAILFNFYWTVLRSIASSLPSTTKLQLLLQLFGVKRGGEIRNRGSFIGDKKKGQFQHQQQKGVIMPTLPPPKYGRIHVPDGIKHPLGIMFSSSKLYRGWLSAGSILSLWLPLAGLCSSFKGLIPIPASMMIGLRRASASHLFLLCCQCCLERKSRGENLIFSFTHNRSSTSVKKTTMREDDNSLEFGDGRERDEVIEEARAAPLPLRILVPIAYNAYRLIALKRWVLIAFATLPPSTVTFSHYYRNRHLLYHVILSSTLLTYWSLNLFAFLIPIASMRYIRSYLYCVKAEEVVLREGDDAFAGLLPSLI